MAKTSTPREGPVAPAGVVGLVLDYDCPKCGWPETRVVRHEDGATLIETPSGDTAIGYYECTSRSCDWHTGPGPDFPPRQD